MLHCLCGSPSIPLSFILANVLPRWNTYCVCCGTDTLCKTTLLGVKIASRTRVPASFFVTVAYMCWACRRRSKSEVKARGLTPGLLWKLVCLSIGGAGGIPSVAVKCVDIGKNTSGEGGFLGHN